MKGVNFPYEIKAAGIFSGHLQIQQHHTGRRGTACVPAQPFQRDPGTGG